jgi:hypothetical protein
VEGGYGTGLDVLKTSHVEEQECLFFVALSRARDRLLLYSPTKTTNGRARARSPFIERLGGKIESRPVDPRSSLPAASDDLPISVGFPTGILLTDHKLGLFERCPRRFLYTHVLDVGGRRTETPFMRMHGAVRSVLDWLIEDPSAEPSSAEVEDRLVQAWDRQGLDDQGYSGDFERVARQLIGFFVGSRSSYGRLPLTEMRLTVPSGEIVVRPDDVLTAQDGRTHVRSVRTGHAGSKDMESVSTAVFALAAQGSFPGCTVELVHLSDAAVTAVPIKPKTLANRKVAAAAAFDEIRAGRFPRKESVRTCPRCPAFFICGPVPGGTLEKRFEK